MEIPQIRPGLVRAYRAACRGSSPSSTTRPQGNLGDPAPDRAGHSQRPARRHASRADRDGPGDDPLDRLPRRDDAPARSRRSAASTGPRSTASAAERDRTPTPPADSPPEDHSHARSIRSDRPVARVCRARSLAAHRRRRAGGRPVVRPGACPTIKSGEPILTFNGKDLTGFYTYTKDHKYDDPKKVFTVQDGMIRDLGRGVRRRRHLRELPQLPPDRRVEVGREDLGPAPRRRPATRASCSTASAPTARRAGSGWSRSSARSSRGAAATSSWSAARASRA